MYLGEVIFSLVGRIGRTTFWIGSFVLFAALILYQLLTGGLVLILMGYAVWGYIQFALLVKRLHDVNRSGFWALTPGAALLAGALALSFANDTAGPPSALWLLTFSLPMACGIGFALGFIAWVGSKPGSVSENRFGDPPDELVFE